MTPRSAALAMLGAALCFGAVEWVAEQFQQSYSTVQIVWTRYAVQLLVICAVAAAKGWNPLRTRRIGTQLFRSMLMVGMPAFFVIGATVASTDSVWAIFWTTPLLAMWAERRWMREAADRRLWALATMALVGVLAILRPPLTIRWEAAAAALAMAACFAGYLTLTRTLREETTVSRLFYTAFGVFVVLTPFVPRLFLRPTNHDWLVLSTIGVLGLACLWCIDVALDAQPAALTAPFLLATPAFYALLNAIDGNGVERSMLAGVAWIAVTLWACLPRRPAPRRVREA